MDLDFLPVAQKLGAQRTLAKPIQREDLLSVVAELLAPQDKDTAA